MLKILRVLPLLPLPHAFMNNEESLAVGGQAVMEGVMMRNGDNLSIAVRQGQIAPAEQKSAPKADTAAAANEAGANTAPAQAPDGENPGRIVVRNRPWFTITRRPFFKRPYIRGFPLLLETMVNGIKALNISAELAMEDAGEELKPWQLLVTLGAALLFAVGLFVVLPHLLTIGLSFFGISGDVEGFSFHLWDGLIKFAIFILYIWIISRLPEIRRVFQYHGAEHKAISAYESNITPVTLEAAAIQSRLHPRCGTTFLLFVLSIAILMHVMLVPLLMLIWTPSGPFIKHFVVILLKLGLMLPISALAYEAIRLAARLGEGLSGFLLRAPGMLLQRMTTREPDYHQIEVALVALNEALQAGSDFEKAPVRTAPYTVLAND
ncbi:MAG: DUF1385 domain-containing protein [Deltaproteobacteria bacterium]|jgi:uncharacterized protein YqhQ|nr:DUF1385 domain-containing protein [Deltaproteobacteria bacterium]